MYCMAFGNIVLEGLSKMNKILTVTVPVYNVENYLPKCLESFIIDDMIEFLEVLIIDDGSPDKSYRIAEKYVKKYPNVFRLIRKENGGHGSAINRGIEEASGRYFKVVDSDDWVDKKSFIQLIKTLAKTESDIVYSNYYWVNAKSGRKSIEFKQPFDGVIYNKEYRINEIKNNYFLKMHGYTIKTDILRKIPRIDEHCFYVDMEFVLFPVPFAETITFIKDFVYMYRVGNVNQSMSTEKLKRNSENYDRVLKRVFKYYMQEIKIEDQKRKYLEEVLARMVVSRIKIFLCYSYNPQIKFDLQKFDNMIKIKYPAVYQDVNNRAVLFLRKTNYRGYPLARFLYYLKERISK